MRYIITGAIIGIVFFSIDGVDVTSILFGSIFGIMAAKILEWCRRDLKGNLFHVMILGALCGAIFALVRGETQKIIAGIIGYSYLFALFFISARETIWGMIVALLAVVVFSLAKKPITPNILLGMMIGAIFAVALKEKIFRISIAHHSLIAGCLGSIYGATLAVCIPAIIMRTNGTHLTNAAYALLFGAIGGALVGTVLKLFYLYITQFDDKV
ncbi:MAG: hypothetical protein ACPGWR_01985 [Ardenticatenaceae bacterium]